jgi:hypothetical protein
MKPIKIVFKRVDGGQERARGGKFDQSTLYAHMEISQ